MAFSNPNFRKAENLLLHKRWPWHLGFWIGYAFFRFWPYYVTILYWPAIFLEFMFVAEVLFACTTYFTIWLYKRLFLKKKYLLYFSIGVCSWLLNLYLRTVFQFWYLQDEPMFQSNTFSNMFLNNTTVVTIYFLFVTSCKYFKDGFIAQQFEAERKAQQLSAEVNNLKSQIAPHFLFNTLNNLYGLAVDKSDKLPDLMLRLSDMLRHSLYETQKPLVPINEEIKVLQSYIELESVRLEDDLKLQFENKVAEDSPFQIAPLLLIVFIENAFKHAKSVQSGAVDICISCEIENDWFTLNIKNNYNTEKITSNNGIGLTNVKRRLELLYPNHKHELNITKDEVYFNVTLCLQLTTSI